MLVFLAGDAFNTEHLFHPLVNSNQQQFNSFPWDWVDIPVGHNYDLVHGCIGGGLSSIVVL